MYFFQVAGLRAGGLRGSSKSATLRDADARTDRYMSWRPVIIQGTCSCQAFFESGLSYANKCGTRVHAMPGARS